MARQYNYIYILTNKISGKQYIGKHSTDNLQDGYMGSGFIVKQIKQKYGKNIFSKQIIQFCKSEEEAFERQRYWINYYNALEDEHYYNLDQGGAGHTGYTPSEQTRQKMSKAQKQRYNKDPENHPLRKVQMTDQIKAKISKSLTGRKLSEEQKQKISERTKGQKNPRAIKVECLNNHKIFNTIKQAAQWCGVDNSTLAQHLKGRTKTCGFDPQKPFLKIRLKWRYVNDPSLSDDRMGE